MKAADHQRIDGIDFWRGFVLLTIFVNHAPENLVAHITHRNFGFSDAAEAFVFLSGLSVALAYGKWFLVGEYARAIGGLYRRALTLYGVQIAISIAGILFVIAAAYLLDSDDLTDDRDRAIVLEQPWRALPAMLVLFHQLGFFNILPLYIVFLLASPLFLAFAKIDRRLMLLAAGALYLATRYFGFQAPTWPMNTGWFFNPFAWQFIFVIGLFVGVRVREGVPYDRTLFIAALLYLAASLLLITNMFYFSSGWWEALRAHVPHDKTNLGWLRLLHFLALAYVFYHSGITSLLRTTWVFAPLALIGRHSLPVFATGAFLTLVGEAINESDLPPLLAQPLIVIGGILIQYWVARVFAARAERRKAAARMPVVAAPPSDKSSLGAQPVS